MSLEQKSFSAAFMTSLFSNYKISFHHVFYFESYVLVPLVVDGSFIQLEFLSCFF